MPASAALDVIGIADWMGLQYIYGPLYTWEGFQLMGFQVAIFRSGGRGQQSIIAWITPSDATNPVLKTTSALAQGVKHFFYWTYGADAYQHRKLLVRSAWRVRRARAHHAPAGERGAHHPRA